MNWLPLRRRGVVNQYDTDLKTFTIFSEKVRSVIICEFKSSMKCDVTSVLFYLKKSIKKLNTKLNLAGGKSKINTIKTTKFLHHVVDCYFVMLEHFSQHLYDDYIGYN